MNRRVFLSAVTGGLFAAPPVAEAQQAGKVSRVGVLVTANPRVYDGFVDELRRLGYVDGQNVVLDFRNAEGKYERFPALAAELVRAGADVILAGGSVTAVRAARQATTTIPVVMVAVDLRPAGARVRSESCAAWRERHWHLSPADRADWQANGASQGAVAEADTVVHLVGPLRRGPVQDCGSCVTVPGYARPIAGDQKSF
jgi:hypothetical protein